MITAISIYAKKRKIRQEGKAHQSKVMQPQWKFYFNLILFDFGANYNFLLANSILF